MLRRVTFRRAKGQGDEDTDPTLLKKNVIIKENRSITDDYRVYEFLGSGKFGEVKRCEEKMTDQQFAAKFVPIACKEDLENVLNEIAIMNKLRHPRLIQLCDAYQMPSEVVMVLELITGGELFERIIDESFDLNESRCMRFMNEILQGIEYIHTQGVLHLDLKPENILCLSHNSFTIKIIDFGLARFYDGSEICVLFGTPEFVSPEVISYEPVTPAADMWSVGVICYVMLSGLSPFMGDSQAETLTNIMKTNFNFKYAEFDEISEAAQDFICHLLVKDPKKRMSASECLQHRWIKRKKTLNRKGTVSKKRLKHFVYRRKWQKAVNAIIALQRMGVVLHHRNATAEDIPASAAPSSVTKDTPVTTVPSNQSSISSSPTNTNLEPEEIQPKIKERKLSYLFGKFSPKRGSNDSNASSDHASKSNSPKKPSILRRLTKRSEPIPTASKSSGDKSKMTKRSEPIPAPSKSSGDKSKMTKRSEPIPTPAKSSGDKSKMTKRSEPIPTPAKSSGDKSKMTKRSEPMPTPSKSSEDNTKTTNKMSVPSSEVIEKLTKTIVDSQPPPPPAVTKVIPNESNKPQTKPHPDQSTEKPSEQNKSKKPESIPTPQSTATPRVHKESSPISNKKNSPPSPFKPGKITRSRRVPVVGGSIADRIGFFSNINPKGPRR